MKYKIKAETVRRADRCTRDHSCLNGNEGCLCNVNKSIDYKIVLVDPLENKLCDYHMSFGNSYICNCPVRVELHRVYKV